MMKLRSLSLALLSAGLLAGCGGDDGDVVSNEVSVQLAGVASKGRMKRADVKVYEVDSEGRKGTSPIASSTTSATDASYGLQFTGKKGSTYVVEVVANSATTEENEITGQDQPLPVGFKMRTAIVAPDSAAATPVQATVTPFSEMAVKAAEGATGGFKPANVKQAVTTVSTMVGFNPVEVNLQSSSDDNKAKLEGLLKSVAAIASGKTATSGGQDLTDQKTAMGCAGKDAGEAVQCVVEKLASEASLTEAKLTTSAVSNALAAAVTATVQDTTVTAIVAGNLTCTENCTAPSPTVYSAVQAAKSLVATLRTNIKADLKAWTAKTSTTEGAKDSAYLQAQAMKESLDAAVLPLDMVNTQVSAITTCLKWKNGAVAGTNSPTYYTQNGPIFGCTLNASGRLSMGINFSRRTANNGTDYRARQVFVFSETSPLSNQYTYQYRSGVFIYPSFGASSSSVTLPSTSYPSEIGGEIDATSGVAQGGGSFALTKYDSGEPKSISMTDAGLPGVFKFSSFNAAETDQSKAAVGGLNVKKVMVNGVFATNLAVTGADSTMEGTASPTFDASLKIFHSGNETTVANESLTVQLAGAATIAAGEVKAPTSLKVSKLEWASANSKLSGSMEMSGFSLDKSGTNSAPSTVKFKGVLSNSADSGQTYVPFLTGALTVTQTGWSQFDDTQPKSSTNFTELGLAFEGVVAAPSRPVLTLTVAVKAPSNDEGPSEMSIQAKSTAAGSDRYAITMSAVKATSTVTLNESSTGLQMVCKKNAETGKMDSCDMLKGTETIAKVNMNEGKVYYKDNTFDSL